MARISDVDANEVRAVAHWLKDARVVERNIITRISRADDADDGKKINDDDHSVGFEQAQ